MTTHTVTTEKQEAPRYLDGRSIGRLSKKFTAVVVAATHGDCDIVDFRHHAGGMVRIDSGSITTLTPYVEGATDGGDWEALYDQYGDAVTITIAAGRWQELPDAIFPVGAVKFVGDAAGAIDVCLKG